MKNPLITLFLLLPILAFSQSIQRNNFTTNNNASALGVATNVTLGLTVPASALGNSTALTMTNMANSFSGNGGGLANLNATNLVGTLTNDTTGNATTATTATNSPTGALGSAANHAASDFDASGSALNATNAFASGELLSATNMLLGTVTNVVTNIVQTATNNLLATANGGILSATNNALTLASNSFVTLIGTTNVVTAAMTNLGNTVAATMTNAANRFTGNFTGTFGTLVASNSVTQNTNTLLIGTFDSSGFFFISSGIYWYSNAFNGSYTNTYGSTFYVTNDSGMYKSIYGGGLLASNSIGFASTNWWNAAGYTINGNLSGQPITNGGGCRTYFSSTTNVTTIGNGIGLTNLNATNLVGTLTNNTSGNAATASGGWPTTLWATNTAAGIFAAGGDTNSPSAYDTNSAGIAAAKIATNNFGTTVPVSLTNTANQFSGTFTNGAYYGNGGGLTNVAVTNITGGLTMTVTNLWSATVSNRLYFTNGILSGFTSP